MLIIANNRPFMIFNKNKQFMYLIITIIILIFFSSIKVKANEAFYAKGHIIHDLKLDLLWLRCSVGQVWNSKKIVVMVKL